MKLSFLYRDQRFQFEIVVDYKKIDFKSQFVGEKYVNTPPEGMTDRDILNMRDDNLP